MKYAKPVLVLVIALAMLALLEIGLVSQRVWAEPPTAPEQAPVQTLSISGCISSGQFQPVLNEFIARTGFSAQYEQLDPCPQSFFRNCSDQGNCPDVALVPWPGMLAELGDAGALVDMNGFISSTVLSTNYASTWIDLGTVDGALYGVWFNANNKSLVWYDPTEFTSNGWMTPTTWTEMITLSEQISNTTGTPPWSVGNQHEAATGWPLTDWFEDILLRSAGPDVYDDLVTHAIPWTHTEVISSMAYFGEIFGEEGYQLGGKSGTLNTHFYEAIFPPFEDPPQAYLHRQASWINSEIQNRFPPPTHTAGTDYAIFPFPDIGGTYTNAVMGGGDAAMVFSDTAEARQLIDFLITTDAAEIWIAQGGTSPNRSADLSSYPDPNTRAAAEQLANASIFRFDLSDQLSSDLNAYLWSQMDDLVLAAPDPQAMEDVLARVEFKASHPYAIYLPLVVRGFDG